MPVPYRLDWPGPAGVVELVDTQDLGSCASQREGSSPFSGTTIEHRPGPAAAPHATGSSGEAAPQLPAGQGHPTRGGTQLIVEGLRLRLAAPHAPRRGRSMEGYSKQRVVKDEHLVRVGFVKSFE